MSCKAYFQYHELGALDEYIFEIEVDLASGYFGTEPYVNVEMDVIIRKYRKIFL